MPSLRSNLPLLLEQVGYNLRGGFLVRPLMIAVTLGLAGALFPSHADAREAQVILGGIATAMMQSSLAIRK